MSHPGEILRCMDASENRLQLRAWARGARRGRGVRITAVAAAAQHPVAAYAGRGPRTGALMLAYLA